MKHIICLLIGIYASVHLVIFNDYIHARSVEVEVLSKTAEIPYVDKTQHNSVSIVYKRVSDGVVFSRSVNERTWQSMKVGDKTRLYLRPLDMNQTALKDIRYLLIPGLVAITTLLYLVAFLIFGWPSTTRETYYVQSPQDSID